MRDSKWFKEGNAAYIEAVTQNKIGVVCPYGAKSAKALIWEEGFKHDLHNPNLKPVEPEVSQ